LPPTGWFDFNGRAGASPNNIPLIKGDEKKNTRQHRSPLNKGGCRQAEGIIKPIIQSHKSAVQTVFSISNIEYSTRKKQSVRYIRYFKLTNYECDISLFKIAFECYTGKKDYFYFRPALKYGAIFEKSLQDSCKRSSAGTFR